ncbi:MAG TPA: HD domain-containing phosphohydrolase [Candidatus Limnocylindria bacterium]|jgi:response regulator RpfG family c-di-GMP phosphodiesterase|nr:HD domain-containing phosphohydrolase [Candidatus Limnocylindria bacterium]
MKENVLIVDDDPNILASAKRTLHQNFSVETATGGEEALQRMKSHGPYAVVISDMHMPGMSGLEFLSKAAELAPDTIRMMLTGFPDLRIATAAVNRGNIFRFLSKPCTPENLMLALEAAAKQYRLVRAEKELLERTLNGCIRMLMELLSSVDPISFGRSQVLRDDMRQFVTARNLGDLWIFEVAAMLSTIGCITVPPDVLKKSKAGLPLSKHESEIIEGASDAASRLLVNIPRLDTIGEIIRLQTKNYDGSGNPKDELRGEDIPLGSRILKVLNDRLDLRESGLPEHEIKLAMNSRNGWYDPRILEAALSDPENSAFPAPFFGTIRHLKLSEILTGMVLAEDVRTSNDMLIVKAKTQISSVLLQRLHNFAKISGIKEPLVVE